MLLDAPGAHHDDDDDRRSTSNLLRRPGLPQTLHDHRDRLATEVIHYSQRNPSLSAGSGSPVLSIVKASSAVSKARAFAKSRHRLGYI